MTVIVRARHLLFILAYFHLKKNILLKESKNQFPNVQIFIEIFSLEFFISGLIHRI